MANTYSNIDVVDRKSFSEFLKLLLKDLKTNKDDWENPDLERFLEAMQSYAEDIQGYYDNTHQNISSDTASWKVFADILRGAVVYE